MASPYTQDINKTVAATRNQNKASYSEQLVGLFGKYVQKEQERAEENVKKLDTDFVFEKQKINSNIKNYNKVLTLQDTIKNDFGGDTRAYARDFENKRYQQDIASHLNKQGKEGFQIFEDYTDVGSQQYLESRVNNRTAKLDKMFATAANINLGEGTDSNYVDSLFTNEINNLPDSARGKGWSILGDLIAGQGLKVGNDYSVTKKDILSRVYSNLPNQELGTLAEDYKNYYTRDKGLAKEFLKNVLPNVKTGTNVNTVSSVETQTFMGQEVRYIESYITYINKNGKQEHSGVTRTALNEDEIFIDHEIMQGLVNVYSNEGRKKWEEMHAKKIPVNEIIKTLGKDLNNFANPSEAGIKAAWANPQNTKAIKALYDDWSVQNGFSKIATGSGFGTTTVVPVAGASEKEGYMTFDSYRKQEMQKSLDLLSTDANEIPEEMGASDAIVTGGGESVAYIVAGNSYSNSDWTATVKGTNPALTDDTGDMVTLSQYSITKLGLDNPKLMDRLEAEYNKGDTTNVSKEGLYFNSDNPFILNVEELEALGMDKAVRPHEFGYNLETEDFVMRNARTLKDSNSADNLTGFQDFYQKFNNASRKRGKRIEDYKQETRNLASTLRTSANSITGDLIPRPIKFFTQTGTQKTQQEAFAIIRDEVEEKFGIDIPDMFRKSIGVSIAVSENRDKIPEIVDYIETRKKEILETLK